MFAKETRRVLLQQGNNQHFKQKNLGRFLEKVKVHHPLFSNPFWLLYFILCCVFISMVFCTSCTTVRYIPVESELELRDSIRIRDSITYRELLSVKDSVILRDSVVTVVDENGKVLRQEYYRSKEKNRILSKEVEDLKEALRAERQKKKEVEQVPYPVEKPLSKWQQLKLKTGEVMMIAIVIFIVMSLRRKF